jgi:iron complex outermembrane receptor protein
MRILTLACVLGAAMLTMAASAEAQAQAAASEPNSPTDRPADQAANTDIVVTAERREQRLQEVPISVTALTGDSLERAGVDTGRDLTQVVPGLNFSRVNTAFQPTIRGVGTRGNSPGDESNVSVYVDGVYQPELATLSFDLLKIERLEVLRGPQGTLFGRNATGGLINIITPDPKPGFSAEVTGRLGNFAERSLQGYATGGSDKIAADVSLLTYHDGGYVEDLVSGDKTGGQKSFAIRSKVLLTPTDRLKIVLTGNYFDTTDDSVVAIQPYRGNTIARALEPDVLFGTRPYQSALTDDPFANSKQHGGSAAGTYDWEKVRLVATASYQDNRTAATLDVDGTVLDVGLAHFIETSTWYTQELRLESVAARSFDWIVGAFALQGSGRFEPFNLSDVYYLYSHQQVWSEAAFAEGTYHMFDDRLRLTAGARYTSEKRDYDADSTDATGVVTSAVNGAHTDFNRATPRVIAQYVFSKEANAYASYSKGFKSGVFNAFAVSAQPVRPEDLDAYEVGVKTDFLPGLRMNLSAYHYQYNDIQVSARDPLTGLTELLNAARAKMNGGELEITAAVTRQLSVRGAATYLDATYTSFPGAIVNPPLPNGGNSTAIIDASGTPVIRAPKHTYTIGADYVEEFAAGMFGLSTNLFFSDSYSWDLLQRLVQPQYKVLSAELSWTTANNRLRFALWGNNLTDALVYQQMVPSANADLVAFDRPRSYGISVTARF